MNRKDKYSVKNCQKGTENKTKSIVMPLQKFMLHLYFKYYLHFSKKDIVVLEEFWKGQGYSMNDKKILRYLALKRIMGEITENYQLLTL